jgi:glycosyltransferase involved in cell wall biosynthesis
MERSIQLHRWLGYLRSLQAAIAPSRFQEQDLLRLGAPRERVHFVPTPMWDLDRIMPVTSAPPSPTPTVAFVGRLSPEKGLEFLLRAWPRVDAPARLIVIGECSEADAGSRVEFVGPRFGADLYQTLAGCDVVVVPSLFPDNSPNVVIEAMALGKPIVATRIGGIPDQVDADCALLVEPWDVAGLARNINALLSDTAKRVQMGEHARARAGSVFHPTLHLDRLEMIFHAAIAGAR